MTTYIIIYLVIAILLSPFTAEGTRSWLGAVTSAFLWPLLLVFYLFMIWVRKK